MYELLALNCKCGNTGGCELCNPWLKSYYREPSVIMDEDSILVVPADSIHRAWVENELRRWNRKMGYSAGEGFYLQLA